MGGSVGGEIPGSAVEILDRLARGPRRICAVDFGILGADAATESLVRLRGECVDVWDKLRPREPGYTYDGDLNMGAEKGRRLRQFRLFFPADLARRASRISLAGVATIRGLGGPTRGGLEFHPMRPINHYGLSADFVFGGDRGPLPPLGGGQSRFLRALPRDGRPQQRMRGNSIESTFRAGESAPSLFARR